MTIKEHRKNDVIKKIIVAFIDDTEVTIEKEFREENISFDINRDIDIIDISDEYTVSKGKMYSTKNTDHYIICLENVKHIDIFY